MKLFLGNLSFLAIGFLDSLIKYFNRGILKPLKIALPICMIVY